MFEDIEKRKKIMRLERTTDMLRGRYGHFAIQRGALYQRKPLKSANAFYEEEFPIFYSY
jgi:hypothetical protein